MEGGEKNETKLLDLPVETGWDDKEKGLRHLMVRGIGAACLSKTEHWLLRNKEATGVTSTNITDLFVIVGQLSRGQFLTCSKSVLVSDLLQCFTALMIMVVELF